MKTLSMILAVALLASCSGMHSGWGGGASSGHDASSNPMLGPSTELYPDLYSGGN